MKSFLFINTICNMCIKNIYCMFWILEAIMFVFNAVVEILLSASYHTYVHVTLLTVLCATVLLTDSNKQTKVRPYFAWLVSKIFLCTFIEHDTRAAFCVRIILWLVCHKVLLGAHNSVMLNSSGCFATSCFWDTYQDIYPFHLILSFFGTPQRK